MDDTFSTNDGHAPGPRGKAIGFLDSVTDARNVAEALEQGGVDVARIELFAGPDGESDWTTMMGTATWGEQSETCLKQGIAALNDGRAIFAVRVADHDDAENIAAIASAHGARNITYFGDLVDTVLTT